MDEKMFYVSLENNLAGYYIPVKAPNALVVTVWAEKNLGRMWGTVCDGDTPPPTGIKSVIGEVVVLTEDGA